MSRLGSLLSRCLVVAVVLAVTGPAFGGSADARRARAHPLVVRLHPTFRRTGRVGLGTIVLVGGRYVYLGATAGVGATGSLLDQQTGKRAFISKPGCFPDVMGGPWLLFECGGTPAMIGLYALATGRWSVISTNATGIPLAVGSDWIDFLNDPGCGDAPQCDIRPVHEFQSISTGRVVIAFSGGSLGISGGKTIPDLDSPALSRKLCRPLQAPILNLNEGVFRGPLIWYGSFLMATSSLAGSTLAQHYLERCGSRRRELLNITPFPESASIEPAVQTASNPRVILWPNATQQLSGRFLPSLRRFTIRVPKTVGRVMATTGDQDQVFLSSRTLYLLDGTTLWATDSPSPPKGTTAES